MAQHESSESRDGHAPGSQPAHFTQRPGGDRIDPGKQPDEVVPGDGDRYEPDRTPDEFAPGQGDVDEPDRTPVETPPQPAIEPDIPAAPD